jgi:hypothetical protein
MFVSICEMNVCGLIRRNAYSEKCKLNRLRLVMLQGLNAGALRFADEQAVEDRCRITVGESGDAGGKISRQR